MGVTVASLASRIVRADPEGLLDKKLVDQVVAHPEGRFSPEAWQALSPAQQNAVQRLRDALSGKSEFQPASASGAGPALSSPGSPSATHVVGADPITQAAPVKAPPPTPEQLAALFTPEMVATLTKDPWIYFDEATWTAFTKPQTDAIDAVRDAAGPPPIRPIDEVLADAKSAPASAELQTPWESLPDNRVMVMQMNVENLFLETDDPTHKDEEFTTERGYTKEERELHETNIAKVIRSVNGGKGPDVISMVEVENLEALKSLVDGHLKDCGYQVIALKEGTDERGIDVGLVSRFPLWKGTQPTLLLTPGLEHQRGILRVELDVKGHRAVAYVNHWKSMRDGEEVANETNKAIAATLRADVEATQKKDPGVAIMALGDFNTKYYEGAQDAMTALGATRDEKAIGDASPLFDATSTIPARREAGARHPLLPEGTHSFNGGHDFLDRIMVNESCSAEGSGLKLVDDSVCVIPTPGRFFAKKNKAEPNGVSDHRPMVAQFEVSSS